MLPQLVPLRALTHPPTHTTHTTLRTWRAGFSELLSLFNISRNALLSNIDVSNAYLASLEGQAYHGADMRLMSFREFREALVRCALRAYGKLSSATDLDKIRGLFLYMFRAIEQGVPAAVEGARGSSATTDHGSLVRGAADFTRLFVDAWKKDGLRDYLAPVTAPVESASDMLRRMQRPRE